MMPFVGSSGSGAIAPNNGQSTDRTNRHHWESTTATTSQIQQHNHDSSCSSRSPPGTRVCHDAMKTQHRHIVGTSSAQCSRSGTLDPGNDVFQHDTAHDSKYPRSIRRASQQRKQLYRKSGLRVFPQRLYEMLSAASARPTITAAVQPITKDDSNPKNEEENYDSEDDHDDHDDDYDYAESTASSSCGNVGGSNKIFGFEDIISWQPHGRSFLIHKKCEFARNIMPRFFHQTKLTSFQRQLNLYGFVRLTSAADKGAYYHELFLRGRPELCIRIHRQKIKGRVCKRVPSPSSEPNFCATTMKISYVALTPADTGCKGSNSEKDNQIGAVIDAKHSKGSKILLDVSPTKEETTQDDFRLIFGGDNYINLTQDGDASDVDNVSVEIMDVDNDDVRDNQKDGLLLDPDDQIEKESLAQVGCALAKNEGTAYAMSIDSKAGPVIVAPRASSYQHHGQHSELMIPNDGPQHWSFPLLQKRPSSRLMASSDATSYLKPSNVQSPVTTPSMWPHRDHHSILQRLNDGIVRGSDHRNMNFHPQSGPTSGTDLSEVTHHPELQDGDEIWFDEGHRFCFVAPTKQRVLVPQPPVHVSADGPWVGSLAAVATCSPTGDADSRFTTVLVQQCGDDGDTCGDLTTTTVDGSTCSSCYRPSLSHYTAGRRGSVPMDSPPPSWPSSVVQQSLSTLCPKEWTQGTTGKRRMAGTNAHHWYNTNPVHSGQHQSQQHLPRQPFWDGRHASI